MPIRNGQTVKWKQHLPVQAALDKIDVDDPSSINEGAKRIVEILNNFNCNMDDICLGFEYDFADVEDVEDFDYYLGLLYDWADDELIWIGPL